MFNKSEKKNGQLKNVLHGMTIEYSYLTDLFSHL